MPGHGAGRGCRGWGALVGAHTPRGFCLVSEKQSGARRLLTKVFGLPCPFALLESAEWGLPGSAVCLFLLMMPPEALSSLYPCPSRRWLHPRDLSPIVQDREPGLPASRAGCTEGLVPASAGAGAGTGAGTGSEAGARAETGAGAGGRAPGWAELSQAVQSQREGAAPPVESLETPGLTAGLSPPAPALVPLVRGNIRARGCAWGHPERGVAAFPRAFGPPRGWAPQRGPGMGCSVATDLPGAGAGGEHPRDQQNPAARPTRTPAKALPGSLHDPKSLPDVEQGSTCTSQPCCRGRSSRRCGTAPAVPPMAVLGCPPLPHQHLCPFPRHPERLGSNGVSQV